MQDSHRRPTALPLDSGCMTIIDLKCESFRRQVESELDHSSPMLESAPAPVGMKNRTAPPSAFGLDQCQSLKGGEVVPLRALRQQEAEHARQLKMEERRKRNRERMARARRKYQDEVEMMRQVVAKLENQLQEQKSNATQADCHKSSSVRPESTATENRVQSYKELNRAYTELQRDAGCLREERYWLRARIKQYEKSGNDIRDAILEMSSVSDLAIELPSAPTGQATTERVPQTSINRNQWIQRAVASFCRPISSSQIFNLIRESYAEITHYVQLADRLCPRPNSVLGWSDKRHINKDMWVEFVLGKAFAQPGMEDLMHKTWEMLGNAQGFRHIDPCVGEMHVLQELNKDTLVVAQDLIFPEEDVLFCTIFLLFRLRTASGYIIGVRTIKSPDPQLEARLGDKVTYTHLFFSYIFSHAASHASADASSATQCHVQFAGRMGNGSQHYARSIANNVLLGALRWENHCVGPFYQF